MYLADADGDLVAHQCWLEEVHVANATLAAMLPARGIDEKLCATMAAAMTATTR